MEYMAVTTITKEKIAEYLRAKLGFSGVICEEIVSDVFESATDLIVEDGGLKIKNLGSFAIHQKKARPGMNLHTGEKVEIPARTVVQFAPSRNLKKRLNNAE